MGIGPAIFLEREGEAKAGERERARDHECAMRWRGSRLMRLSLSKKRGSLLCRTKRASSWKAVTRGRHAPWSKTA